MNNSVPRIIPPIYFLGSIIAMVVLNAYGPIGYWLYQPWTYFGIPVIFFGFMITLLSGNIFRRIGTPRRPGLKATELVTSGAFRYTRNPMYLGLVLTLVGIAVLLGTFSPIIVIPFFIWIIQTQFILKEEQWLEDWFGNSYIEYKKKTHRWL